MDLKTLVIIEEFPTINNICAVPKSAEEHTLTDFVVAIKLRKISKFIGKLTQAKTHYLFICPGCNGVNKELTHGNIYGCECGLKLQSLGNSLKIWK